MGRSTVHYADSETNNILKRLHNKLRPAGTPVQRVEYIIELLLLRIFEVKLQQDPEFAQLRAAFKGENDKLLFSELATLANDQILPALNQKFFPFYARILSEARKVWKGNLSTKVQDQLVLIEEVFSNSNFSNNVTSGNMGEIIGLVAELDKDRLLKTDLLGDAIESALSETGGTKDIGLHRTPDHIRQFMVGLVAPTFADQIFDPTVGTGGFMFDSFEYVMQGVSQDGHWPGPKSHPELAAWFKDWFAKHPVPMPSIETTTDFYRTGVGGIEYLGMVRKMAAINFYVRGLNPGNIQQGNALEKFGTEILPKSKTVILANPPFGAERDKESYPNVWSEYPTESETTILFVKLMLESLKPGGRCAVIVSEGFLTWDQNSARALRRALLDECDLQAVITALTKEAMGAGVLYDHLLDPETRQRIELPQEEQIELERLNKRILSEEQAKRWAEIIRANTEYGEKVLLFAASQPHALMLVKELNMAFNDKGESPRYAEAIISENDEVNESLKEWFERPYSNPRVVVSVDIMSTGVDIPCLRDVAFGALTKSVGKYLQMLGRGTRLDPKTGKFSFTILDFVKLCERMEDNGKGTPKPNIKVVIGGEGGGGSGGGGGILVDGILDNPDPANLIQRAIVTDGNVKIVDNIPVAKARELFEQGVKSTQDPLIAELKRKAWENKDYEPTEEELAAIKAWAASPDIILTEEQLQRIYEFPAGSVWDFFLAVLGVKKIPTTRERIEVGFDAYVRLYNFTPEQADTLRKIKDAFVANLSSQGRVDVDAIFANPIYARLIGSFEQINQRFDGKLKEIVGDMQKAFKTAA